MWKKLNFFESDPTDPIQFTSAKITSSTTRFTGHSDGHIYDLKIDAKTQAYGPTSSRDSISKFALDESKDGDRLTRSSTDRRVNESVGLSEPDPRCPVQFLEYSTKFKILFSVGNCLFDSGNTSSIPTLKVWRNTASGLQLVRSTRITLGKEVWTGSHRCFR